MTEMVVGPAPGQSPLLDAPPCHCDERIVNLVTQAAAKLGLYASETLGCPIGPAVALALAAASLVNPQNAEPETRANACEAARIVAETMEKIARGIRMRASE